MIIIIVKVKKKKLLTKEILKVKVVRSTLI